MVNRKCTFLSSVMENETVIAVSVLLGVLKRTKLSASLPSYSFQTNLELSISPNISSNFQPNIGPGSALHIFRVGGRAIGKGIYFPDICIKNGINFHNFGIRNVTYVQDFGMKYKVGYTFSKNWYKVEYAFSKNWYKVGYAFSKHWYEARVCF